MRGRRPGDLRAREWGLAPAHSAGTLRVLGAGTILGGKIFFPLSPYFIRRSGKHVENPQSHVPITWNLHLLDTPPHCPRPGCPPALSG